jgi:hypothetical protein
MARSSSRTTTDHDEIRRWAEERGAQPAEVEGTERGQDDTGILRLDFPGYTGTPPLRHISWDEWFDKFDASGLALVYQEATARGQRSNFNKLVAREAAEARAGGETHASRRSIRGGGGDRRTSGGSARAKRGGVAARRAEGTGRTRRAGGMGTRGGEAQSRRKAPRATAARVAGGGRGAGKTSRRGAAGERSKSGGRSGGGGRGKRRSGSRKP